jgi:CDP-diacylglycerol--glycerol-3-phosphate 3-phosphatidyltransferase
MNPAVPLSVPNLLSLLRLALVPVQGALAFAGLAGPFLASFAAALASDVADGQLARRSGQVSALGARLDSIADLATWATLPLFLFWLWPDLLRAEAPFVAAAALAFALPTLAGLLRFGRLTSYHTFGAKLCSWLMAAGALALVVAGSATLFHVATAVLAVAALEELAITALLPAWQADVPSLWHALRARDRAQARKVWRASRYTPGRER